MRLRIITALVYATVAAMGVATIASQLRLAAKAFVQRYTYAPDLATPWLWLLLGAAMALTVADVSRRMAARRRVGMARYASILLLAAAGFIARKQLAAPPRPTVQDGMPHLVARVEIASEEAYERDKAYTDDKRALTAVWPVDLRDLGFFERGALLLNSRLLVSYDASGPILAAPVEARPGDVVIGLSRDKQSYWISSFDLNGAGNLTPLVDERGRAIVAHATQGRAANPLDPLFPDYPNKSAGPTKME